MPLTWKGLDDCLPPLNLWNYPAWVVPLQKEKKMLTTLEKIQTLVKTIQNLDKDETNGFLSYEAWDYQQKLINAEIVKLKQELKEGEEDV